MAKEYKTSAHPIYDIQYHLVWCTKYRYPVLRGEIGERCRDLLRQIAMAREITVIRGALAPDHVHMLGRPHRVWRRARSCSTSKDGLLGSCGWSMIN